MIILKFPDDFIEVICVNLTAGEIVPVALDLGGGNVEPLVDYMQNEFVNGR
jgi:hypothetical protein